MPIRQVGRTCARYISSSLPPAHPTAAIRFHGKNNTRKFVTVKPFVRFHCEIHYRVFIICCRCFQGNCRPKRLPKFWKLCNRPETPNRWTSPGQGTYISSRVDYVFVNDLRRTLRRVFRNQNTFKACLKPRRGSVSPIIDCIE